MAVSVHHNQRISSRGRQNLVLILCLLAVLIARLSTHAAGVAASWAWEAGGMFLLLSGLWIRLCARQWKAERVSDRLVTDGFYGYIRNPLYVGSFLVWAGLCLVVGDPLILLAFVLFFGINHALVIRREEAELVEIFGAEYLEYRRRVPSLLPRPQTAVGRVIPRRLNEAFVRECDAICIGLAFPLIIHLVRQLLTLRGGHPDGSTWIILGLIAGLAALGIVWARLKQSYRTLIRDERLRRGED